MMWLNDPKWNKMAKKGEPLNGNESLFRILKCISL